VTRTADRPIPPLPEPGTQPTGPSPDPAGPSLNNSWLETAAPGRDAVPWQPLFVPGALVAGRYRIVRFLAQGGMGQVYEAQDLELAEPVALKTLRPDIAQNEQAIELFKREIQLARKVTHQGVCRIFDIGRHRLDEPAMAEAGSDEVLFFTMELLQGESLRQRLLRTGRMRPAEALGILLQMAEALRAAHAAGVVHRDFKSQNVMLCRKQGFLRVVVTDFGLACPSALRHGRAGSLAGSAAMIGTAAYMAPEQVEGKELRPATDVYAFGVVMYEMLTGQLPFSGQTALETALMRLKQDPPAPRLHAPELSARWERTILRCLERDPRDRFAGAVAAVQMLLGEELNRMDRPRPRPQARSPIPLLLASLGVVGVATLAQLDLRSWMAGAEAPAARVEASAEPAPARLRRSVAILGFQNLSSRSETAWIAQALAEMLRTELGAHERLRVLAAERVTQMSAQLAAGAEQVASETALRRMWTVHRVELLVQGSYLALGHEGAPVRLDVSMLDARTGEIVAALSETGSESGLAELAARAGRRLRERFAESAPAAP
jgi:eukaryotic-like serine/threonine-protein kinase